MTCQLMAEANGHKQKGRALIDTGSSVSYITSRLTFFLLLPEQQLIKGDCSSGGENYI